jgi:hypothetical protein
MFSLNFLLVVHSKIMSSFLPGCRSQGLIDQKPDYLLIVEQEFFRNNFPSLVPSGSKIKSDLHKNEDSNE